jgi:flavin-dependent dehydrogenase
LSRVLVDVLTVGGGPAGSTVAAALARAGFTVVVLEKSRYERGLCVGEVVPPVAKPLFSSLDLWNRIAADAHKALYGIVAQWGGGALRENDFIYSPYGHGWSLDRSLFDRASAEAAQVAGARVMRDVRLNRLVRRDTGWSADVGTERGTVHIQARFLVDASGRRASTARSLGAAQLSFDRMVAVVGTFEPASGSCCLPESRLILEAVEDGWWYAAPLPGGRAVAAYLSDADLLKRHIRSIRTQDRLSAAWDHLIMQTVLVRDMLTEKRPGNIRLVECSTKRLIPTTGDAWLAVGDACMTIDPLSSQGILSAVRSGTLAATCIARTLHGDDRATGEYAEETARAFNGFLDARRSYYAQERRWRASEFWRRRHDGDLRRPRTVGPRQPNSDAS